MVELSDLQVSRKIVVAASPEHLYEIIADVTRIGELSPVCKAAWWDEGSGPREGGWFTGRNEVEGRDPWERHCEIITAEPGRAFGWVAGGRAEGVAEWSYRFRPVEQGTEVEESWRILRMVDRLRALGDDVLNGMKTNTESGIESTLANLKRVAES
jgi:Polyketide cyclase / dehydrase and lipid transport